MKKDKVYSRNRKIPSDRNQGLDILSKTKKSIPKVW